MFKKIFVVFICLFTCVYGNFAIFGSEAFANSKTVENNNFAVYKNDLLQIENYLNNITHLSADFVQELDNQKTTGKFY